MENGTIVDLFVKVADQVKKGDVIFEVETDKAAVEVESPADGFVKYIAAELGGTLSVGDPVMVLGDKNEKLPQSLIDSVNKAIAASAAKAAADETEPVFADPGAESAEAAVAPIPLSQAKLGATVPLGRIQKITGQKMLRSKREIPCFYLNATADVTDLVGFRAELNSSGEEKISYNDFILLALGIGLQKFPIMTGALCGDAIRLADSIDIGLTVSVPDGLVVAVVRDVPNKGLRRLARDTKTLIEKARSSKLLLADLEGACITVSNLGTFGVDSFIPVVVPGQCSILGVGTIVDTAVAQSDGDIAIRKLVNMTLSVDHRVANGAYAGQFLDFVRKLLEDRNNFA